jgi:hypothetical protein
MVWLLNYFDKIGLSIFAIFTLAMRIKSQRMVQDFKILSILHHFLDGI